MKPRNDDARTRSQTLLIRPWWEPELAVQGHDPLGEYAEVFWLPVLGPSALCALRWLCRRLVSAPEGFEVPHREFARSLGLGSRSGANSPSVRCLERLGYFHLVRSLEPGSGPMASPGGGPASARGPVDSRCFGVRTHLPELPRHLERRLPRSMRNRS
ncbi:MAG: hypothetical protein M9942_06980 [Microthrixaceae bacterium]|nr:hypothetical protein [Microthrixaceae bacterium]MCO5318167.1 hypothetical protein [Microthrixaceae bacterium]